MGYNPCYCWNLRDGCITIGIWSLVFAIYQTGLFCWQSYVLQGCRQLLMIESLFNNCQDWCPCSRNPSIETTHRLVEGIFIIQIINIIAALFLLFASGALIYGIHTNSKHLVWPWFPCICISIITSSIYCILWWAGDVESYWLVLTIVEFLSILVNVYCLLCVIVQYTRILKGYVQQDDEEKPRKVVYEYLPKQKLHDDSDLYKEKSAKRLVDYDGQQPAASKYHHEMLPTLNHLQKMYGVKSTKSTGAKVPLRDNEEDDKHKQIESPEFKARFTEAWINGVRQEVASAPPVSSTKPKRFQQEELPPKRWPKELAKSLDHLRTEEKARASVRSSKSKDSLSSRSHHHHHHCRHNHHCSHRRHRSRTTESSLSDDDGSEGQSSAGSVRHARSCSSRRSTRSLGAYSSGIDDASFSAAGPSPSDADTAKDDDSGRRRRRRCRCRHRSVDDSGRQQHRRPRDVKREDRRRRDHYHRPDADKDDDTTDRGSLGSATYQSNQALAAPKPAPRHPVGAVPVLPSYASLAGQPLPPGAISIPQNIVIPPRPVGTTAASCGPGTDHPQKYQINSEITIHYDDRPSTKTTPDQQEHRFTPSTAPVVSLHDTSGSAGQPEPRRYASTAV